MQSTTSLLVLCYVCEITEMITEKGSNCNVSLPFRKGERRVAITICRVHVEARRSQQRRDRLGVASSRRQHERRVAMTICRVHVEARRSQQRDDSSSISTCRRTHEYRQTLLENAHHVPGLVAHALTSLGE